MKNKLNMRLAVVVLLAVGLVFGLGWTKQSAAEEAKQPAQAETNFKDYGNWRLQCIKGPKGEVCNLFQRIVASKDKNNVVLLFASIVFVEHEDKRMPHLRMVAPLGSFLPTGLALNWYPRPMRR